MALAWVAAAGAAFVAPALGAQLLVSEDAGVVPIAPDRREAIAPNGLEFVEVGLHIGERRLWRHLAGDVALTRAKGTGATAAQQFIGMDGFVFIAPGEDEAPVFGVKQIGSGIRVNWFHRVCLAVPSGC